jgi:signal transduction histidine kinase
MRPEQLDPLHRRRGFSLRAISLTALVVFGVLVTGLAAGLLVASRSVWRSTERADLDAQAIAASEEIDRALREYQRLANLSVVTHEPALDATRSALETDVSRLLVQLQGHLSTAGESRLLAALSDDLNAYLAERKALEAERLPLDEIVAKVRPTFERALARSHALRSANYNDLRQTKLAAAHLLRVQYLMVLCALVVMVIGLLVVALGVRRLVLRPVFSLQETIARFRSGSTEAKAPEAPPREMRELAAAFNEMLDTITRQRRDQLTFLAAVAHDLRNPLSALKMIVQTVEREPTSATPDRFRRLDRQLDRLTRMVGDLLDATQIESGHLELKRELFDLRESARTIVDLYAPTTATHQVILKVPEEPVIVYADPLRLEQVISNLLSNAIKYSPGGGCVELLLKAVDGRVELSVSDRGLGIPAEDLPNLFQPFRRRPSTAASVPGVGLGLSIVRRIVTAHGGDIDVESEPGAGSTFRVRLEARTGLGPEQVEHHPPAGEPEPPRPEPR